MKTLRQLSNEEQCEAEAMNHLRRINRDHAEFLRRWEREQFWQRFIALAAIALSVMAMCAVYLILHFRQ